MRSRTTPPGSTAHRAPRTGWRRLLPTWRGVLATVGLVPLLAAAALLVGYLATPVPAANAFATSESSIVYWSGGERVLGRFASENRQSVTLEQIPLDLQRAVVAAEDRSFWDNAGVDPAGIARAAWSNLQGDATSGGSTITQQYVKNYYLTQDRTWLRKAQELFIALKVDRETPKDQILTDYLNTIWFGRGSYGVQTASLAYFREPVARLDLAESAALAALIQSPARLDPEGGADNVARLQHRFRYVLDGMAEKGWITRAQARSTPLPEFSAPRTGDRLAGPRGFLLEDVVRAELGRLGFSEEQIDSGGLRVTTTFDRAKQAAVEAAVESERPDADDVHVAVASVEPATGRLVAMYGGPDYVSDQRNWALTGRQPGSTFKPFALTAALEDGESLDSRLAGNSPYVLPGGATVRNEFGRSYGESVSLLYATEESINTAYTDLALEVGPDAVVDAAVRAGVPSDAPSLEASPSVTLGVADVTPVDMANAYATYAAEGRAVPWTSVEEVRDRTGAVLYEAEPRPERVFSAEDAADTTYALQQVVEDGTGTAAQQLGRPAAGKTGTAALRPDTVTSAWFVGYTPQLSTAVMYVRGDDGTADLDGVGGLSTFFGGEYPARTWTAAMAGELEGSEVLSFPERSDRSSGDGGGEYVDVRAIDRSSDSATPRRSRPSRSPSPSATAGPTASASGRTATPEPPAPEPAATPDATPGAASDATPDAPATQEPAPTPARPTSTRSPRRGPTAAPTPG